MRRRPLRTTPVEPAASAAIIVTRARTSEPERLADRSDRHERGARSDTRRLSRPRHHSPRKTADRVAGSPWWMLSNRGMASSRHPARLMRLQKSTSSQVSRVSSNPPTATKAVLRTTRLAPPNHSASSTVEGCCRMASNARCTHVPGNGARDGAPTAATSSPEKASVASHAHAAQISLSASTNARNTPCAEDAPLLRTADTLTPGALMTRAPASRATSAESSVDPLSTTMISCACPAADAITPRRHRRNPSASLRTGMMKERLTGAVTVATRRRRHPEPNRARVGPGRSRSRAPWRCPCQWPGSTGGGESLLAWAGGTSCREP